MPSTVIASVTYHAASATLQVVYVSGLAYLYKNVPEEVYKMLKASGAKGRYLNHHIKGRYAYEKIST